MERLTEKYLPKYILINIIRKNISDNIVQLKFYSYSTVTYSLSFT